MAQSDTQALFGGGLSMVTASLGKNDPVIGDRIRANGNEWLFVYNAGNSQISTGRAATASGVTGYSVTVSTTVNADVLVGVCHHATLTTATYGWLLTRGIGRCMASTSVSASTGTIIGVGTDGFFGSDNGTSATTSALQPGPQGKVLVTTASATSLGTAWYKGF